MINIRTVFLLILALIILILVGLFFVVLINSSDKPKPFLDKNGNLIPQSISEKIFVDIKGTTFGLFIKGKNKNNPVLLYLHGGMPDYFLNQEYPTKLDEIFTVAWWDQRGAGLSYNAKSDNRDITVKDLIEDTKDITDYLRKRFSQEKIYLMGHSGGTYLGIKTIEKYPELYKAYMGVAQISNQKLSEKKAYDYILNQYKNDEAKSSYVKKLEDNPVQLDKPIPAGYYKIRDQAMHDLGVGTMREMKSVITGIFIPSLMFREYTIGEKINLWKGKVQTGISVIWNEVISNDLSKESTPLNVPVYFFHGIYDYTCSYDLAKDYFKKIDAPEKAFYTLNNSAHSPIFEEPDECIKIIRRDILLKH